VRGAKIELIHDSRPQIREHLLVAVQFLLRITLDYTRTGQWGIPSDRSGIFSKPLFIVITADPGDHYEYTDTDICLLNPFQTPTSAAWSIVTYGTI
jgi:hypothetical protein